MKSPFPGMDPYLEQHWRDVRAGLVIYARDQLQPELPDTLRARVEERVYVLISVDDEPVSEGYVEIIDVASGNRVITVIEFLSPSNKIPGDGQDLYLRKQKEVRLSETSLVEVDLTRQGRRILLLPPERIPPPHRTTYQACVKRGYRRSPVEIYDLPLRRRLPVIGIPLRDGEKDVALGLQALVDSAYRNGGYDDIDYRVDPVPPLEPADATWADRLLRSKGLRPKKGGKRPRG